MAVSNPEERRKIGESLYTRALGLASDGQLNEADHHFQEALVLCPQDARIWYHRGHLHEQMGRLESAIHCYNKSRSADRSNPVYERAWREAVRMLDQLPDVPEDAADEEPRAAAAEAMHRPTVKHVAVPAPPERAEAATVEEPPVVIESPLLVAPSRPRSLADIPMDMPKVKRPDPATKDAPDKAVVDLPLNLPVFASEGLESLSTQMFDGQDDPSAVIGEEEPQQTVRTVERIGGTWVLWNSCREDDSDELDTLRTSSDEMFSNASSATLVVPLDELEEDDEDDDLTNVGRPRRNTASFVNRRNARILDSSQLSVIGMACLRLIAEGDAEQVVELMSSDKYPDLPKAEASFLLATAYITLAEKTLLAASDQEGGLAEHLKTLKLWFEQR